MRLDRIQTTHNHCSFQKLEISNKIKNNDYLIVLTSIKTKIKLK